MRTGLAFGKSSQKRSLLSEKQLSDSGMALSLILLLLGLQKSHSEVHLLAKLSVVTLVLTMTAPRLFYPFAVFWFKFSEILGAFMSKLVLTVAYAFVLTPLSITRNLLTKVDILKLNAFKSSDSSVFKNRDHTFNAKDLAKPY